MDEFTIEISVLKEDAAEFLKYLQTSAISKNIPEHLFSAPTSKSAEVTGCLIQAYYEIPLTYAIRGIYLYIWNSKIPAEIILRHDGTSICGIRLGYDNEGKAFKQVMSIFDNARQFISGTCPYPDWEVQQKNHEIYKTLQLLKEKS